MKETLGGEVGSDACVLGYFLQKILRQKMRISIVSVVFTS